MNEVRHHIKSNEWIAANEEQQQNEDTKMTINITKPSLEILPSKVTQPANIGPQDVPRTSPSSVPKTSPIDPIWPSRGRPNLTSRGRPEMTSRGNLNLTFKGRPWEVDSGRPQDVQGTFSERSLEDLQSTQTWMSKFIFNFSFRTYSIDQI